MQQQKSCEPSIKGLKINGDTKEDEVPSLKVIVTYNKMLTLFSSPLQEIVNFINTSKDSLLPDNLLWMKFGFAALFTRVAEICYDGKL